MLNRNIRILIILGHGANDSGAVYGKLVEREMNVICGNAMWDTLRTNGFNCDVEVTNKPVDYEMKLAKGYGLVISIHFNAGGGDGFEALCNPNNKETVAICKAIEKAVKEFGQNSRGIKSGIGYKMVSGINENAIILEGGFIDNPNDSKLFDEEHELIALGQAYAKGIMCYYFNVKPQEKPQKPNTGKKGFYRVVVGSYTQKTNAEEQQRKLKEKGFDSFFVYLMFLLISI